MPTSFGLDIAGGKWALVEISSEDGLKPQLSGRTVPYGELKLRETSTLVADVPIGLLQDHEAKQTKRGRSGDRPVDRGARRWCRSTSSVFPPPTAGQYRTGLQEHGRAAEATTKSEQRRKLAAVVPGGLTFQALELLPAIKHAKKLKSDSSTQVFESHPEVVFAALANGVIPFKKKSLSGAICRAGLLAQRLDFPVLRWVLEKEVETRVPVVDWLDALSMALVAHDWSRQPDTRQMLADASGCVVPWQPSQLERIMALPSTTLETPPPRLQTQAVIDQISDYLAT